MKTPCRAACKNNGGMCSGCFRTMDEIIGWKGLSEDERVSVMDNLTGASSTHQCPQCNEPAQCDISAGKDTCWCFELENEILAIFQKLEFVCVVSACLLCLFSSLKPI